MSFRRAAKKDDNHKRIERLFRTCGWSTWDTSPLKKAVDLVVGRCGITIVVEIKDGSKPKSQRKLTEGEEEFKNKWLGEYRLVEFDRDVIDITNEFFGANRGK